MAASLSRMRLEPLAEGSPKRAWNFSHSSISSLLQGGCAALMRLPAASTRGLQMLYADGMQATNQSLQQRGGLCYAHTEAGCDE